MRVLAPESLKCFPTRLTHISQLPRAGCRKPFELSRTFRNTQLGETPSQLHQADYPWRGKEGTKCIQRFTAFLTSSKKSTFKCSSCIINALLCCPTERFRMQREKHSKRGQCHFYCLLLRFLALSALRGCVHVSDVDNPTKNPPLVAFGFGALFCVDNKN